MGLECYFGIWSHDPSGNGFCGDQEYPFIDRAAMLDGDPNFITSLTGFLVVIGTIRHSSQIIYR